MNESLNFHFPPTTRIEAFSDGVLAIIITLLVLEIKVPELHNAHSIAEAFHALNALTPKFLSFVLSFVFVAVFWVNHHQFFHLVRHADRWLLWLNNLLLLTLSFVPFPTAFIGDYPRNPVALALFGVALMAAGIHGYIRDRIFPQISQRSDVPLA